MFDILVLKMHPGMPPGLASVVRNQASETFDVAADVFACSIACGTTIRINAFKRSLPLVDLRHVPGCHAGPWDGSLAISLWKSTSLQPVIIGLPPAY